MTASGNVLPEDLGLLGDAGEDFGKWRLSPRDGSQASGNAMVAALHCDHCSPMSRPGVERVSSELIYFNRLFGGVRFRT